MTLREALERGATKLGSGPHPEKARRDAELLLLHQTEKNRAWLVSHLKDDFAECHSIGYETLLTRRAKGEPVQYILGECEFYKMPFRVTPDVLIPRPETELLVEKVVQLIPVFDRGRKPFSLRIVDIGTGSGAIAISIAHDWSEAQITAIDSSSAALEIARLNADRLGFAGEIRFLQGDLLGPVAGEQFDLVVSNPPYVPLRDRETLSVEVRDHEPSLALFAGEDGLDIYRRLIPAASAALAMGGFIALEIGYGQADAIRNLLSDAGFVQIEFTPDLQGIPRVVTAQRG